MAAADVITERRLEEAVEVDPALAYPMPDVEALVWAAVRHLGEDYGAGITTWCYASVPLPGPAGWHSAVNMQIDVRDVSKAAAFRRADIARRIVLGLPGRAWPDGIITNVQITGGPSWLPDFGTGRPRYVTQAVVQVHPVAHR